MIRTAHSGIRATGGRSLSRDRLAGQRFTDLGPIVPGTRKETLLR